MATVYSGLATVGGFIVSANQCAQSAASIPGAMPGMTATASPRTSPGIGVTWQAYVSAPGVVQVLVCTAQTMFINQAIYDVTVTEEGGSGGGVTAVTGIAPIASSGGTTPAISVADATSSSVGVVQPDNVTITISAGVISAVGSGGVTDVTGVAPIASSGGTTPAISVADATSSAVGVVKPDDTTITVAAGVITAATATSSSKGIVQPDNSTITISAGVISAVGGGGVTAVTGVAPIASSGGTTPAISVADATSSAVGVVKPDDTTITVAAGVITAATATSSTPGIVQPDNSTITISAGVISAAASGLTKIAETVLSSPAASITFSSIPAGYRTLRITFSGAINASSGSTNVACQFNGDTGSNYDTQYFYANGSATNQGDLLAQTSGVMAFFPLSTAVPQIGTGEMIVPGYSQTTFTKGAISTFVGLAGTVISNIAQGSFGVIWNSTAAINEIVFFLASGDNFAVGTTFSLYGMA